MTFPYSSGQDGCEFVGDLAVGSSTDVSSDNASALTSQVALKLFNLIKHLAKTEDPTAYTPDAFQLKILALINALLTGQQLINRRGAEIEPKFFGVAKYHDSFTKLFYDLLEQRALLTAWTGTQFYKTPLPTVRPSARSITFTGTGANTLKSSGDYTGKEDTSFTVEIVTSTTFKWKKGSGDFSDPVTMTGSYQDLSDGVSVKLPSADYIEEDQWVIPIKVYATQSLILGQCPGLDLKDPKKRPTGTTIDKWIDWVVCPVYAIAVAIGYPVTNLTALQAEQLGEIIGKFVACFALVSMALQTKKSNIDLAAFAKIKETNDLFEEFYNRRLTILRRVKGQ